MPYANNKGAGQTALLHSLISTFVVRCLVSIISLVSISEISSLWLVPIAESYLVANFKDRFSCDEAQLRTCLFTGWQNAGLGCFYNKQGNFFLLFFLNLL